MLRQLARTWPASNKWRDAHYLHELMGHRLVPIEIGQTYTDETWSQRLMLFSEFYRDFVATAEERPAATVGYLAQTQLLEHVPQLMRDILVPDYCYMGGGGGGGGSGVEVNAWFGPEGTVSPLHTDRRHNIFVQLVGSKVVLLFDAQQDSAHLYPHGKGLVTNTSQVDAAAPDLVQFPLFAETTTGCMTTLSPGDALFIPKGMWHYVKSLQPSWSLSFWFD